MDTGLSDLLTCPRCGPTYGLVLLPHEVRDRRVATGVLGCANCRERYPVEEGVADLRVAGVGEEPAGAGGGADAEEAVRLAALLGLAEASGTVLLAGPAAAHAGPLSEVVPDVDLVVVGEAGGSSYSALRVSGPIPMRSGSLRGVALTGARVGLLEEGARVVGPAGRLLLEPAPEDARDRVEGAGLTVLLEEEGTLVAKRGG